MGECFSNSNGTIIPNITMVIICLQVKEVRTLDDTMITVKLMLFYELKDVMKMVG
jgi:hypothetical protein